MCSNLEMFNTWGVILFHIITNFMNDINAKLLE